MAKKDALVVGNPAEFGTGRAQPGTYLWHKFVYALHPNRDGNGIYMTSDLTLADPDTGEIIGTERNLIGFVTDKGHKKIQMCPSKDGKTIAGTDDVDEEMILNLAKGDINFKDEEEEALFAGPYFLHRPGITQMKGNQTQLKEEFDKLVPGVWDNIKHLGELEGYVFDMDRRPQKYGSKKDKDSDREYDVLVPVDLVSRPSGKANGSTSTTAKKSSKSTPKEEEEDSDTESESSTNPKEKEVEKAILASIGTDWTAHRSMMSTAMEAFEDLLPDIVKMAKNDDWLYSEDRPWEGNLETKKLRKRKK